jgi:hypothetical protein
MYDFVTSVSPRDPVNPAAMSREQIEAVLQFVAKSLRSPVAGIDGVYPSAFAASLAK